MEILTNFTVFQSPPVRSTHARTESEFMSPRLATPIVFPLKSAPERSVESGATWSRTFAFFAVLTIDGATIVIGIPRR